jgi:hypothetical protein
MLKKIALAIIILIVLIVNAARFWKLDTIPYGFHVDEVGSAVTVQCFTEKGCDAELRPWPLFGRMEYGQDKPPTYVYPAMLWAKIFGSTVPSLRAFSVAGLLIGILGLFFLSREMFGSGFGLAVVLAATCSPWSWVVTRVALESYLAPVFAVWGLYFFWRSSHWWDWALAGFLLACAMYTYPPARLQIPLMMATLLCFEWGRRSLRWPSALSLAAAFGLTMLPIFSDGLVGVFSRRFKDISIFSSQGNPLGLFIHNYLLHLSPDFLFFTGDPSYVHSTRHLGLFSWFDVAALVILVVFIVLAFLRPAWIDNPVIKNRGWLIFMAANFFIGIIPSALTNQELPHALRICGSWPFMMLFSGFMWWKAAEFLTGLWLVMALAGLLSCGVLTWQYFTLYPKESMGMFDYWVKDTAEKLQTQQDWQQFLVTFHRRNYHCRYFLVHLQHMSCKQANDLWWRLHDYLDKRGMF